MMTSAFYFILKALFVLKIFNFFPIFFFCCRGKQLDNIVKVNFKIYDEINWETNNYNTQIKFDQLIKCNVRNTFLFQKSFKKYNRHILVVFDLDIKLKQNV